MSTLFRLPQQVAVDSGGTPYAGALANFHLTGTTTDTQEEAAGLATGNLQAAALPLAYVTGRPLIRNALLSPSGQRLALPRQRPNSLAPQVVGPLATAGAAQQ